VDVLPGEISGMTILGIHLSTFALACMGVFWVGIAALAYAALAVASGADDEMDELLLTHGEPDEWLAEVSRRVRDPLHDGEFAE
jgi:hypothetical protein